MTINLRSMIGDIKMVSDSVASGSEQLNTNSDEISRTLSGQSAKAQQIATATEEMSQTVMDIAKNTSDIASAANESWAKAKEGVQVVDKSVSESRAIADTVNDSATVIQTLGEKSKQIGEILGVIKDIADQTNLLALNAAIEAARAGEQGRGFSVVADEVRKLAEKTAAATTEIGEMIQSIQSEVDAAVTSMHKTSEQVQIGLRYSMKAGVQLESIVGSIVQLQGMAQQIATATEEMSSTSESISSDLQGVAGASTEISGGSKQIASSSSELAMHAGKLKEIIGNFKV